MIFNSDDIRSLGTILGIWAHPDDESWTMAGIMSVAIKNGQRVVCLTATAGEAGDTSDEFRWPKDKLRDIRRAELASAMDCIGVSERYWLDYEDGRLDSCDAIEAAQRIQELIDNIKPDTIITFEPEGITGHPDHKTISTWAMTAVKKAKKTCTVYGAIELTEKYEHCGRQLDEKFDIYFNTTSPVTVAKAEVEIYFELPQDILDQKLECLRLQASQTAELFADPEATACLTELIASEHFIRLS